MDPDERSGGLILVWGKEVTVYHIRNTSFSIEVEFETLESGCKLWAIFVYESNKEKVRRE